MKYEQNDELSVKFHVPVIDYDTFMTSMNLDGFEKSLHFFFCIRESFIRLSKIRLNLI